MLAGLGALELECGGEEVVLDCEGIGIQHKLLDELKALELKWWIVNSTKRVTQI